jgi:hypothetical protein
MPMCIAMDHHWGYTNLRTPHELQHRTPAAAWQCYTRSGVLHSDTFQVSTSTTLAAPGRSMGIKDTMATRCGPSSRWVPQAAPALHMSPRHESPALMRVTADGTRVLPLLYHSKGHTWLRPTFWPELPLQLVALPASISRGCTGRA